MLRLKCAVQTYAWGKPGHSSTVAQLKEGGDDEFKTEEDVMYAELWMGTHPSGPSRIVRDDGKPGVLLKDYLKVRLMGQCAALRDDRSGLSPWSRTPHPLPTVCAQTHPDALGSQISTVTGDLPFMFKVLSINKALSIQVSRAISTGQRLSPAHAPAGTWG
jgi:mannose-6-phosphate isomerase